MQIEAKIGEFWQWFSSNAVFLHRRASYEVVELVLDNLHGIDEEVSAEVSSATYESERELVLTSHGNPSRFHLVTDIVKAAPKLSGWRFQSLKPPRGFDFSVVDNPEISVGQWTFVPLKSDPDFNKFGFRIEMSQRDYDCVDGVAVASIIEEGIGEVLLSVCSHFEYGVSKTSAAMPIRQLSEAIYSWCVARGPDAVRPYLPAL